MTWIGRSPCKITFKGESAVGSSLTKPAARARYDEGRGELVQWGIFLPTSPWQLNPPARMKCQPSGQMPGKGEVPSWSFRFASDPRECSAGVRFLLLNSRSGISVQERIHTEGISVRPVSSAKRRPGIGQLFSGGMIDESTRFARAVQSTGSICLA